MYRLSYLNESTIIPNRQYRLLKRLNEPLDISSQKVIKSDDVLFLKE